MAQRGIKSFFSVGGAKPAKIARLEDQDQDQDRDQEEPTDSMETSESEVRDLGLFCEGDEITENVQSAIIDIA